jgi:hypothetical protein
MTMPQLDLSTWLNDEQTCAALGCSVATLDRRVKDEVLHPRHRQREGKRPERVFEPAEVAGLRPKPPQSVMTGPIASQVPSIPSLAPALPEVPQDLVRPLIVELLGMVAGASKPPTLWTDLDTAAEETGLSRAFLRKMIVSQSLTAVKDGPLKVRRVDLQEMDVSEHIAELKPLAPRKRGKRKARK